MRDVSYFTHPLTVPQRRYEAMRAFFVDHLPAKIVAERFGFSAAYLRFLKHQFRKGKIDFFEPSITGPKQRFKVGADVRKKIVEWRQKQLSAGQIAELLNEEGIGISIPTVARVLAEEGFKKLPRRTRLQIGFTVKGAEVPERSEKITVAQLEGKCLESDGAGVFLFAPFIAQFNLDEIVRKAGLPQTKSISVENYILSFLALKLLGTERYAHVDKHSFDEGLGLFTGLNVIPKCTSLSTYSYSLDKSHLMHLQKAFVQRAKKMGLYDGSVINLDFHTIPHYGEESELEKHWAGARGKVLKGALTLIAQDAKSKLILYTAADIKREEADDQVLEFISFWNKINRGIKPTLVFDSKLTTYKNLSKINQQGIKFITLRRRGRKLVEEVKNFEPWEHITIPHAKRKFPNPYVHQSHVLLRDYDGELRQVVVKGNGREEPSFLISNDFDLAVESLVGDYSCRWRVENGIAEAVKFFNLNSLSSPILTKVHFDVVMTMIADTLYNRLAQQLRGFEECDAPKIFRDFVRGKGTVDVKNGGITVTYPKRAHNPILRAVPWHRLPQELPWLDNAKLSLNFK